MLTTEKRKCRRAAARTRRWAERNWGNYQDVYGPDLEGMCGIASVYLFRELKREGIKAKIIEGSNHAFVMYKDHIVDVTATQFKKNKIIFRKRRKSDNECDWWNKKKTFYTDTAFIKHQEQTDWPRGQIYGHAKAPR